MKMKFDNLAPFGVIWSQNLNALQFYEILTQWILNNANSENTNQILETLSSETNCYFN